MLNIKLTLVLLATTSVVGSQINISEDQLPEAIPRLQGEIVELTSQLNQIAEENIHLRHNIDLLTTENRELNKKLPDETGSGKHIGQQQDYVGFTAFANGDVTYSEGEIIRFQQTILNVGSGFDTSSGIFTCLVTGHYFFTVHLFASAGRVIGVSINKNGMNLTKAYVRAGFTQSRKASTSIVQQCTAGEQVYVLCRDSGRLEGSSNAETSFSGFLITQPSVSH